jgi:hypothetical protein
VTSPPPRRPALGWLILASAVVLVFGVAASFVAMFTPMMFDAPGSIENPLLVTLATYVAAGPLVAVTALGVGWARVFMGHQQ